jgi:transposase
MGYYWIIKRMSNKFDYRLKLVEHAKMHDISKAAKAFDTTRITVRKWLRRYEQNGLDGLRDFSRAPKNVPHKMNEENEANVVYLREKHKNKWGAIRLKDRYKISGSHTAIHRVIKQRGLVKKKRRKWRKRKNLSKLKRKFKLFEKNQVDVKDLSDILAYWPLMRRLGLPRYEYTWRDLSIGASFFAYANKCNSTYAKHFAEYVIEHLKSYGVKPEEIKVQTDNGKENVSPGKTKPGHRSAFQKVLDFYKVHHARIPPRHCWKQADVETFHNLIEEELFDIEGYANEAEFMGKSYAYQLYFNYVRKNRYRGNVTPCEELEERFPETDTGILNLPPVRLETLLDKSFRGGYHVPGSAPSQ